MTKNKLKRLVIYLFYDKDGIIDSYIPYMLNDIKKNVDYIYFVSNGRLQESSKNKISGLADKILERKNIGFDVWGYKEAILDIGWKELFKYDELIMMNYTIMGPVYPFKEMFDTMAKRTELDFWGITQYHKVDSDPFGTIECGYIPDHIQSHFLVVRNKLLKDKEFKKYWEDMPMIHSYSESIGLHETKFTYKFGNMGYKWDTYVDTNDLKYLHPGLIIFYPSLLIKNKKCPIFKRRSFFHDYDDILTYSMGEPCYELLTYLKNNTDYDINMIWENILRCYDMSSIKENCQFNFILPEKTILKSDSDNSKKALVFHAYFDDLIYETKKYIESMPLDSDIYITTNTPEKKKLYEDVFSDNKFNKLEIRLVENRGRDVSALLVCVKDIIMNYDIVCFAHDKKVSQLNCGAIGKSFAYNCLENLMPTNEFVTNVLNTFKDNPKLGLLTPMTPFHGDYNLILGNEWTENFEITSSLAHTLGINVPINEDHVPVSPLGTMFWFRPVALKKLFDYDWEYKDFPKEPNRIDGTILHAIERIYGFTVQDAGYYVGWLFSDKCASMSITNLTHMLSDYNHILKNNKISSKLELSSKLEFVENLEDCGRQFKDAFPGLITHPCSELIKLYYDTGKGFNEKETVLGSLIQTDSTVRCKFNLSNVESKIVAFRIDPGEQGFMYVRKPIVYFSPCNADSAEKTYNFSTNSIILKDGYLFLSTDPMFVYSLHKPQKFDYVYFEADITSDVSNEVSKLAGDKVEKRRSLLSRFKNKLRKIIKK